MLQVRKCSTQSRLLLHYDSDGQDLRMGRRTEMGRFTICSMHVDLHQRCAYRVAGAHAKNAGVLLTEDGIHYVVRELGL